METEEYARMRALEDEGWWFVARRELAMSLMPSTARRVLDLGCGTGATLAALGERGVGLEFAKDALEFTRARHIRRVAQGDGTRLPFRDASFNAALALDVYEHIEADVQAMRETRRVLVPGGVLIASVPAHPRLWSGHDEALHHHRRYTKEGFRRALMEGGFRVRRLTWCTTTALPAVAAMRLLHRHGTPRADVRPLPRPLNAILRSVMRAENAIVRRWDAPFGVSLIAIAEAPA